MGPTVEMSPSDGTDGQLDSGATAAGDDDVTIPCGWFSFHPRMCQRFRTPRWLLFCLCWVSFIQGMIVGGFTSVIISSVERRFQLSSTESGLISSFYDIASVLCLMPVSYFGGMGVKSRYLGLGMFTIGVGTLLFCLPHFTTDAYRMGTDDSSMLCTDTGGTKIECGASGSLSYYKYMFYFAMLIMGSGGSPLFTLGPTYLDDSVPVKSASTYLGIYHAMNILGPGVGFLVGGAFLKLYVDIDKVDVAKLNLNANSSQYVGAWWIGYLIGGVLAIVVAIPLAGFPKSLPDSAQFKHEKDKEVHANGDVEENIDSSTKGKKLDLMNLVQSLKILFLNPMFVCMLFVTITSGFLLAGFATFLPKFFEIQFGLSSSSAALYVGASAICAGAGGTFLGGYIVERFNLQIRGILKLSLVLLGCALLSSLIFIANCSRVPFAGINVAYGDLTKSAITFSGTFKNDSCHASCNCVRDNLNPVCGKDGITYFSPCFAGCTIVSQDKEIWEYTNCSCVGNVAGSVDATLGTCESSCQYLPVYVVFIIFNMFFSFCMTMPSLTASLRCIPTKQRTFGLGIQWVIAKCLGFIPGPIMFGKLIDMSCVYWQNDCGDEGSCILYDNEKLSYHFLAITVVGKALSLLFLLFALLVYKSPLDNGYGNDVKGKVADDGSDFNNTPDMGSHNVNGVRMRRMTEREIFNYAETENVAKVHHDSAHSEISGKPDVTKQNGVMINVAENTSISTDYESEIVDNDSSGSQNDGSEKEIIDETRSIDNEFESENGDTNTTLDKNLQTQNGLLMNNFFQNNESSKEDIGYQSQESDKSDEVSLEINSDAGSLQGNEGSDDKADDMNIGKIKREATMNIEDICDTEEFFKKYKKRDDIDQDKTLCEVEIV
ncbi:solute carrier organic anion transporter family member 4A1-like [Mizuhopecten yessoensis]|uniref:Solute carrier organic anion transporter family member n=1 Tax=Mizuhopecten yessoensis TaxID=6573 RepID=A0A210QXI0_MIZYE|nr:solute carrier organic anion transporter family member 4A1-like [Mizuhopecten yessoensis]OWF53434.1 Solute carrier organic anion transporter family member 4A1 [Mizuhopecten yessoensis]